MHETCSLDVADGGSRTLEEVGDYMGGVTRQAIEMVEGRGFATMADRCVEAGLEPHVMRDHIVLRGAIRPKQRSE